jgi:hypothetical protein
MVMDSNQDIFFLIWNGSFGNAAIFGKEETESEARRTAERLAQGNPGERIYVLIARESVVYTAPVSWSKLATPDDVPF